MTAAQDAALPLARLQVVHNAPDPALTSVDVYVNGVLLPDLDDLGFRAASPFFGVAPGAPVTIAVAPDTSTELGSAYLIEALVPEADRDYYVVVSGLLDPAAFAPNPDGRSTALALRVTCADCRGTVTVEPGAPRVRLITLHGVADTAYGFVLATANGSGYVVSHAIYGEALTHLLYPFNDFYYRVELPGREPVVVTATDVAAEPNSAVALITSGFLDPSQNQNGPSFAILAVYEDGAVRAFEDPPVAGEPEPRPVSGLALRSVAPNPAAGAAAVTFGLPHDAEVTLEVMDLLGRLVWRSDPQRLAASAEHALPLDLDGAPPGVYVCRLTAQTSSGPLVAVERLTVAR